MSKLGGIVSKLGGWHVGVVTADILSCTDMAAWFCNSGHCEVLVSLPVALSPRVPQLP